MKSTENILQVIMLVKLEVRDLKQEELIDQLKKYNKDLEVVKSRLHQQNRSLVVSLREKYSPIQFVGLCPQMQSEMFGIEKDVATGVTKRNGFLNREHSGKISTTV